MQTIDSIENDMLELYRRLSEDLLEERIDIKGKTTTISAYRVNYPNKPGSYIRIDIHGR